MQERYQARGVSASKEEVHAAIQGIDKGLFPSAFCKVVPDLLAGSPQHCCIMHADGAGTKSSLAYALWRHTGNLKVWKGIAQDAIVMNTDDLLCAGATGPILFSSTIGRNKRLIPGEVLKALIEGTEEVLQTLRQHSLEIHSTGGETADLGDLVRTVVVDSTVVARLHRSQVVDNARIAPGQLIVGLSSTGQASYEDSPNSGMGSNGLTSARHDLFGQAVAHAYPECCDPGMPSHVQFTGPFGLDDTAPGLHGTVAQAVLSPTRSYAPVLIPFLREHREAIAGIIHCSGGGQTKVLHFAQGVHIVKDNLFPIPPLFQLIQQVSGTSWAEMYQVFNMGHRMEVYLSSQQAAESLIALAESMGVAAQVVGHTLPAGQHRLSILGPQGIITY